MANVNDVAAYVVEKMGAMPAVKFQKLLYYCQAWHLVWDEEPLFADRIEAWANGPVVPRAYREHRGQFRVESWRGDPSELGASERETIDVVLDFYGDKSSQWLSELTHSEAPWRDARRGLPPGARGNAEISKAAMAEYYGALGADEDVES